MSVFVRQLDGSAHAGDNCGPAAVASALRWATGHRLAPTPTQVRRRMGDKQGGTSPAAQADAWKTFAPEAERLGLTLREMKYRPRAEFARLLDLLRSGFAATIAIDYSLVPDELKGDPVFDGYHAVFVSRIRQTAGAKHEIKVWDPLCDGRRAGIPGPGPVWYDERVLRRAAGGYAGSGLVTLNRVERCAAPPVEKPDGCDAQLDDLHEEIARLRDVLGTARWALDSNRAHAESALADIDEVLPIPADEGLAPAEGLLRE